MDDILEKSLLYDFYGELLTAHQKQIYEDVVFGDYSLSEVADEHGISRQGVHDLIKRCNATLKSYEDKLHLVEKFIDAKEKVAKIKLLTDNINSPEYEKEVKKIKEIAGEIMEDL